MNDLCARTKTKNEEMRAFKTPYITPEQTVND